eukprot:SAG22_NODE_6279_length_875_cov_1.563144_2_plen_34_part_01
MYTGSLQGPLCTLDLEPQTRLPAGTMPVGLVLAF